MKNMMRFAVLLSLAVLVVAAVPQSAQASCEYPHRLTIHYWGWPASDGSYYCRYPLIAPWTPATIIGEKVIDCDGSITTWGDLSCSDYTTTDVENCPPVCD